MSDTYGTDSDVTAAAKALAARRHAAVEGDGTPPDDDNVDQFDEEGEGEEDIEASEAEAGGEEGEGEGEGEPAYVIEVNGEEVEVPLSELKAGYTRSEDFRQKELSLAAQSQQYEAAVVTQYREHLEQALAAIPQMQEPDWATMATEEPERYPVEKARWDQFVKSVNDGRAKVEAAQKRELELQVAAAAKMIPTVVPQWRDLKVREKETQGIQSYLLSVFGENRKLAAEVWDFANRNAHVAAILRMASLYSGLATGEKSTLKKVQKAPKKLMRPGGKTSSNRQQLSTKEFSTLQEKHRQSGSVDSAVALLQAKRAARPRGR